MHFKIELMQAQWLSVSCSCKINWAAASRVPYAISQSTHK